MTGRLLRAGLIESRAQAGLRVHGVFTRVDAPRLLACTWIWSASADEPGDVTEDTVEVSFEADGEGQTVVTVRHTSIAHVEGGGAQQGWNDAVDRLAALLSGGARLGGF